MIISSIMFELGLIPRLNSLFCTRDPAPFPASESHRDLIAPTGQVKSYSYENLREFVREALCPLFDAKAPEISTALSVTGRTDIQHLTTTFHLGQMWQAIMVIS
jgi:hypothetical protein